MPRQTTSTNPKRDEIVEIASRLFYEQGFGATGIKQIIDEAGIAKGTFYSHFESKEELGLAWLRLRHAVWNGWFADLIKDKKSSGEKLLASFVFLEKWLEECDFRGCAFINTMAETPERDSSMRKEVAAHKRELHETFQNLAADHFQGMGLSKQAARQKGTIIYLLFEGSLVEAQNFHETWPVRAARKEVKTLLHPKTDA